MNRWILVFAALAALISAANSEKKVVCYFGSWAAYQTGPGKFAVSDIQPNLCTHLIYSFITVDDQGNVKSSDPWLDLPDNSGLNGFGKFNNLRTKSPKTKTLVAIGGWNDAFSRTFSAVINNPTKRANFVKSAYNFVKKHKFNGLDLDWEYPNANGRASDVPNFVKMIKDLKSEFEKSGLIVSAAVAAGEATASRSYKIAEMCKLLDFVNLMTYDFHGSWDTVTGHNSPLYSRKGESADNLKLNVDAAVKYWLSQGCPADKLILGVPFYGRTYTLADKSKNGVGAPASGPGTAGTSGAGLLGYNEICENFKKGGWTIVRHKEHQTPYAHKGNQWIGYDDVTSITDKAKYIKNNKLGGGMLWSIETDDAHGKCGEKYPLLNALNKGLK